MLLFFICFTLSNEATMFQALLSGFSNITMVFEALVRMKDVSLVYKALVSQMDELPESCLVMALQCFLRWVRDVVGERVDRVYL